MVIHLSLRKSLLATAALLGLSASAAPQLMVWNLNSPASGPKTEQGFDFTVRNLGDDTAHNMSVTVLLGGENQFTETTGINIAPDETVPVTLEGTVTGAYGETMELAICMSYTDTEGAAHADTSRYNVTMPESRPFPYEWAGANAPSDFTYTSFWGMGWNWEETLQSFYVSGRGSNWGGTLATKVIMVEPGTPVALSFGTNQSLDVELHATVTYDGVTNDTIFNQTLPQSAGNDFAPQRVFFTAQGPFILSFKPNGDYFSYGSFGITDINIGNPIDDVELTSVLAPSIDRIARTGEGTKLTLRVTNNSARDYEGVVLKAQWGETVVSQEVPTLAALGWQDVTLDTAIPETDDQVHYTAWIEAPGDQKLSNDSIEGDITYYDALDFPYATTFDEGNELWTMVDGDGDRTTWQTGTLESGGGVLAYVMNYNAQSKDYALSPAIRIPAGKSRVSFYYTGTYGGGNHLRVLMGKTTDPQQMTEVIFDQDITNIGWLNGCNYIDIDEEGVYYLAFEATGSRDQLLIDNLKIDRAEDLCINGITFGAETGYNLTTAPVTISFINHGLTAQSGVQVAYMVNTLDESTAVVETVDATVEPGDTLYYTFTQDADVSVKETTYTVVGKIVTVVGDDTQNDMIVGQTIAHYPNRTLPYENGFEAGEGNMWKTTTHDGTTWGFDDWSGSMKPGEHALIHNGAVPEGEKDWAFSECIEMPAGQYQVEFFYNGGRWGYDAQQFGMALGTERNAEAMTTPIADLTGVEAHNEYYQHLQGVVDVAQDGMYYLGVYNSTSDASGYCYIDSISIRPLEPGHELTYVADLAGNNIEWQFWNNNERNPHWVAMDDADDAAILQLERTAEMADWSQSFEDMLVSPKFAVESGREVRVTLDYSLVGDTDTTAMMVYAAPTTNSPELESGLVQQLPLNADSAYVEHSFVITPEAETLYLAMRTNSPRQWAYGMTYKFKLRGVELAYVSDPTGVETVKTGATVTNVSYVNLQGVASSTPWQGVNIVVTTYSDGTKRAVKQVR